MSRESIKQLKKYQNHIRSKGSFIPVAKGSAPLAAHEIDEKLKPLREQRASELKQLDRYIQEQSNPFLNPK